MPGYTVRTATGRTLDELSVQAIRAGELTAEDLSIGSETLRHQADAAEAAGYSQLAENLRRAAELTHISDQEVLEIYNALRPNRSSYSELVGLADRLASDLHAPLTAAFVREAAEVYQQRGLLRGASPRRLPGGIEAHERV